MFACVNLFFAASADLSWLDGANIERDLTPEQIRNIKENYE